jgi:hypothetical protein
MSGDFQFNPPIGAGKKLMECQLTHGRASVMLLDETISAPKCQDEFRCALRSWV